MTNDDGPILIIIISRYHNLISLIDELMRDNDNYDLLIEEKEYDCIGG